MTDNKRTVMLAAEITPKHRNRNKPIPKALIYEIMDGRPLYYEGYKDVLANKKTTEQIMGASGLQSYIIYYLLKVLYAQLDSKKYIFLTNEIGTHLDNGNNLSGDVYIYEKEKLPPEKINTRAAFRHYVDVRRKLR